MFNRSISGQIAKFLFLPQPIVWVEGRDDYSFYDPILKELDCRIEPYRGKEEGKKLAEAVIENNYPFVVIMDGDYEILEITENPHQRVIILQKYSIENYLYEREVIQKVCSKYAGNEDNIKIVGSLFDQSEENLEEDLFELVVLDVANYLGGLGFNIFPEHVELVLNPRLIKCMPERIEPICAHFRNEIGEESIARASSLVQNFLQRSRFSDLIRGHFIFGIIRHLIISSVYRITAHKLNVDNDSLLILLSLELWNSIPDGLHEQLMQDIFQAINSARQIKNLVN